MLNTGYYTKLLFVITEEHMFFNMTALEKCAQDLSLDYFIYFLPKCSVTLDFRLWKCKKYFRLARKHLKDSVPVKYLSNTLVVYSNAEGFLLSNKDKWMPALLDCKEVGLQHGLMPLVDKHELYRKIVTYLSILIRHKLIGSGFGGIKVDKIVVFGRKYADFLVKKKKWIENDIVSSTALLKPNYPPVKKEIPNSCLFLLQDLTFSYLSKEQFKVYCERIIVTLQLRYQYVLIRKHPKMSENVYDKLPHLANVYFSSASLIEDVLSVQRVYSFFSTALIDAYLMKKEVVAIYLPEVHYDAYECFNRVVSVDKLTEYLSYYGNHDEEAVIREEFLDMHQPPLRAFLHLLKK